MMTNSSSFWQSTGRALLVQTVLFAGWTAGRVSTYAAPSDVPAASVRVGPSGTLEYASDSRGNQIVDFSHCGYAGGNRSTPVPKVRVVVAPGAGDDRERIQTALDDVAQLPIGDDGLRGAVRLTEGQFQVAGQIRLPASGVVLQGSGAVPGGTVIHAVGPDRRPLVAITGAGVPRELDPAPGIAVVDAYVPAGARQLTLEDASRLAVGDRLLITRPSTEAWIEAVGARGWKPGSRDLRWDRVVTAIDGNRISLDAPITTALDATYGGGWVTRYQWPGRLEDVGLEDMILVSDYDADRPHDEDHAWYGTRIDRASDSWVRRVVFRHFAGGAVHIGALAKSILVEDCISEAPVSEIGGYRRHTYFTLGQTTLFHRCWSESGRHDFSAGHAAAGPNAFVHCRAHEALAESGPIESWASGVLYDNVRIDGADLALENRWNSPPKTMWAAANSVLWNCRAANVRCFSPPGAANWAVGIWATPAGDGRWENLSDFVAPLSLFQAQLAERRGVEAAEPYAPLLGYPLGATSPTYDEAEQFARASLVSGRPLVDHIREKLAESAAELARQPLSRAAVPEAALPQSSERDARPGARDATSQEIGYRLDEGWLVVNGRVKTGDRYTPLWWRGTMHPDEAARFGPNVTRFVPGRYGVGLTDDLREVAAELSSRGVASYEHHYGLWYDRRRDDHLMVRRGDGAVVPPFYEQPFARSGQGRAWDGLSKYDLQTFNPWYWNRLTQFARLLEQQEMYLLHHNYFQHNILEAGAHWADCPWRPANNVNATDLPEPPAYVGDKRVFMGQQFYDISNPKLRALHRTYIRKCLAAFSERPNVIQLTSEEFTGPLSFVQFWIDEIIAWNREHEQQALIGLSCTKDVQDAILADPQRGKEIDVIDIRYWYYNKEQQLVAPLGGRHLAPRQHMRQLRPEAASFASIVKAVAEYRRAYPDKAILYNADRLGRSGRDGWAVLIGGGSLANVRLPDELARRLVHMRPSPRPLRVDDAWLLESESGEQLLYMHRLPEQLPQVADESSGRLLVRWLDPQTGEAIHADETTGGGLSALEIRSPIAWIRPEATADRQD